MVDMAMYFARIFHVFVPFPGDFFSMPFTEGVIDELNKGFRPLSRGLFFNCCMERLIGGNHDRVFVPFPGDFFSI